MLRKFLIPTLIACILILLNIFTTITGATSVITLTSTATPLTITLPPLAAAAPASNISATIFQTPKSSDVSKFLKNAAKETTTSLLPLQPPLNVTSTTLASFILNQKHQQQQRQRKQQQILYLQKQRQQQQLQDAQKIRKQRQPPSYTRLLNENANYNKEIKKKNLDSSFVTVDVITPVPSSTNAYIPFDLDYNDPTEEKAAQQTNARQSTINEVLNNLFPKGFSDIFRFSYVGEQETSPGTASPLTVLRSSPTPFKSMPTRKHLITEMPPNATFITVSTTVTKEIRREISPGHTEIIVEKVITDPGAARSSEDFKDGSNSISKDELLRISRAAKEASVLPSVLLKPYTNASHSLNETKILEPIVILNENNNNDDFVDAPEDDNQIAETQDVMHQVIQPPPAESSNFHVTPTHQYNVRIIHDNTLKNNRDGGPVKLIDSSSMQEYQKGSVQDNSLKNSKINDAIKQDIQSAKSAPSYQAFVEQSKYIENSLQEMPSRKFLKNFQNPILTDYNKQSPVSKGNFHYEQDAKQNHIQTVAPAAQLQYMQYLQEQSPAETVNKEQQQIQQQQNLHTQIANSQHLNDNDMYRISSDQKELGIQSTTPVNLVFVTINTPISSAPQQLSNIMKMYNQKPHMIPAQPIKSPHDFVSNAMGYSARSQQLKDHQAEQSENNPKPSNGGYTFVEVQKSINIHNKLITEKDGRLIEPHETIYPEQKYTKQDEQYTPEPVQSQPAPFPSADYVLLSQNPIHVEQLEEQHEPAASVIEEHHIPKQALDVEDFGLIQQSNLVQESHIIEAQQQLEENLNQYEQPKEQYQQQVYVVDQKEHKIEPGHHMIEQEHLTGEIIPPPTNFPQTGNIQIPYALPENEYPSPSSNPVVIQEIVKHIPVPYGVPEPVGIPVHIQHFIDRPYPVETIVEKPVPYPVEKVVEKVVEKHVPVEVEKIVEKPVEVIVKKLIDRPVAIPIKIPVALHLPAPQHGPPLSPYGPAGIHYPPPFGGSLDHASTWPQQVNGGTFTRIPSNILKAYYVKMLKKLVPQMQQSYKSVHAGKGVPKITQKPYAKPKFKISDILYDLKPPPPRAKTSTTWDVGARYQYDYNTLPLDLSASSSISMGVNYERPSHGYKSNFDEFQRWRNGHNLKRSPDFGRNLHMEYGFKPPLVPSVEIDDKGVPLKAVAELTNGK